MSKVPGTQPNDTKDPSEGRHVLPVRPLEYCAHTTKTTFNRYVLLIIIPRPKKELCTNY